jgi:hypothetical protein
MISPQMKLFDFFNLEMNDLHHLKKISDFVLNPNIGAHLDNLKFVNHSAASMLNFGRMVKSKWYDMFSCGKHILICDAIDRACFFIVSFLLYKRTNFDNIMEKDFNNLFKYYVNFTECVVINTVLNNTIYSDHKNNGSQNVIKKNIPATIGKQLYMCAYTYRNYLTASNVYNNIFGNVPFTNSNIIVDMVFTGNLDQTEKDMIRIDYENKDTSNSCTVCVMRPKPNDELYKTFLIGYVKILQTYSDTDNLIDYRDFEKTCKKDTFEKNLMLKDSSNSTICIITPNKLQETDKVSGQTFTLVQKIYYNIMTKLSNSAIDYSKFKK